MAANYSTAEYLARQREYRKKTGNASTKRYEKTKRGFLMRVYRNILSRVNGIQPKYRHLYEGLPAISKVEFYDWALGDQEFHRQWDEWVFSGHLRRLTPSIDRIDPDGGYVIGNIRWLPMGENSSRSRRGVLITAGGVTRNISQWARLTGLANTTIRQRLNAGISPDLAVSLPATPQKYRNAGPILARAKTS